MAAPALEVDDNLIQYATPRQREVIEAIRALTAVTYHSKFGEVGTNTVTPEMLEAA